ncbi:hypothetical protein RJP34_003608 [Salmonella enterica]|nr:hypothetical protein [Salmonella enterica]
MINARDLFVEISNQPVLENGESVGYFVKNSRMDALEELLSANSPQPAPVVPEECPDELLAFCEQVIDSRITANAKADELWNACRAAMLQGVEQPQNARQNIPENIPDGNSPAIPDDWVMVPKEPTQAMIKAWLSEVANWRGHVAGYKAALAAAPQQEIK